MADNVGYTPGTGATIAADEIGGVLHQRVKLGVGADGQAVDVSESNPMPTVVYGELLEAIEALRMTVQSLSRSGLGLAMPDTAARMRVAIDSISASLTLASVSTVSTVSTVTTVSTVSNVANQTQMGGVSANDHMPSLMRMSANGLRDRIIVT
jgi:hypothetical protein